MKLKDVIRLEKTVVSYGRWGKGEIDRSSWPLRRKKLKFSSDWQWRVVSLRSAQKELRVLLHLNLQLEEFRATLGEIREETIAVLCCHELHTSHGNWHCHVATGDIEKVRSGVTRDYDTFRRWPNYEGECTLEFDVTSQSALRIASDLYQFEAPAQGELTV